MAEDTSIVEIPITKAKRSLQVNTREVPMEVFREAVYLGFKHLLNNGMTGEGFKTAGIAGAELEKVQTACFARAEENLKAIMAGEIRFSGAPSAKAAKVPAEVKTEAMRLARAAVVQEIKNGGEKVSHYAKSDITKWAKEALENDPSYLKLAEEEIARRKATPVKISLAGLKPDAKLVKAAEDKAAARKSAKAKPETLSKTQAAIPARRGAVKPSAHATH